MKFRNRGLRESRSEHMMRFQHGWPFGDVCRQMPGYLTLPTDWADDPALAAPWGGLCIAQVAELQPKAAKPTHAEPKLRRSRRTVEAFGFARSGRDPTGHRVSSTKLGRHPYAREHRSTGVSMVEAVFQGLVIAAGRIRL